jgi:glycosyltransferase involved in cell wall biosynthesis
MSLSQNIKKTINYSKKNGYAETFIAAWERVTVKYHADYKYVVPDEDTLEAQREDKGVSDIKFSILVPAYETDNVYMEALIESCLAQTYEDWELIISDGSTSDIVKDSVMKYSDSRIKYIRLGENGGISENTNAAIEAATGDYCGLLDHDDLITPDALYEIAYAIQDSSASHGFAPIFAYSDEDKCDSEGVRFYDPHFKLDFNLDLLLTNNYVCHFTVIKTDIIKKLKIRKEYDGSQDYDLILRIVSHILIKEKENTDAKSVEDMVVHVPRVLYHWRCHENSTADNPQSKMYAYEAGKKALIDFAQRMGWKAEVRHNKHLGFYRIEYRNGVLKHRPDLAAVGGLVSKYGKVASGTYKGQPVFYAGYMNRMDLYQNTDILDIRNLAVNKGYKMVYEKITGHPYESTFAIEQKALPQWIKEMGVEEILGLNKKLSNALMADGARLLLDPVCVRKI